MPDTKLSLPPKAQEQLAELRANLSERLQAVFERTPMERQQASRIAGYIPASVNLMRSMGNEEALALSEDEVTLLEVIGAVHDAMRESDDVDVWEAQSAAFCKQYLMEELKVPEPIAEKYSQLITGKEKGGLLGELFQAADALDIMRNKKSLQLEKIPLFERLAQYSNGQVYFQQLAFEVRGLLAKQHDLKYDCNITYHGREIYPAIPKTRDPDKPELKQAYEQAALCYDKTVGDFAEFPLLAALYDSPIDLDKSAKQFLSKEQRQALKAQADAETLVKDSRRKAPLLAQVQRHKQPPQPEREPLGPYTQSEAHLKLILGDDYKPGDTDGNLHRFLELQDNFYRENEPELTDLTDNAENKELRKVLSTVLNNEAKDRYAFYHAADAEIGFIYGLFSEMHKQLTQNPAVGLTRLRDFNLAFHGLDNVVNFLDSMDKQEPPAAGYNYRRGYTARGASVNPFLTGNWRYPGSSTLNYWLHNYSQSPPDFKQLLPPYFEQLGFSAEEAKAVAGELIAFFNDNYTGADNPLLQVLVAPEVVDDMVYTSEVVGDRLELTVETDAGEVKKTFRPSDILALAHKDPDAFEALLKKNHKAFKNQDGRDDFGKADFSYATVVEGRLFLKPEHMSDESKVKVNTYWKDPEKQKEVTQKLQALTTKIIARLLQQRQFRQPASLLGKPSPAQVAHESIRQHSEPTTEEEPILAINIPHYIVNGPEDNWERFEAYLAQAPEGEKFTATVQLAPDLEYTVMDLFFLYGHSDKLLEYLKMYSKEVPAALICAAENGHLERIKTLLERDADPNIKASLDHTALFWAAKKGHLGRVKALLERDADPNIKDSLGRTALFWAAENGHLECVKVLLERGADPSVSGSSFGGAFTLPTQLGDALSHAEYLLLDNRKRNIIARHPENTRVLIQKLGATFAQIQAFSGKTFLSKDELRLLVSEKHNEIRTLVLDAGIPFNEFMALKPQVRRDFMSNNADKVKVLLIDAGMHLNLLAGVDPDLRDDLIVNADEIKVLVRDAGIPLNELIIQLIPLKPHVRRELISKADKIKVLMIDVGLSFNEFMALDLNVKSFFLRRDNVDKIKVLVVDAHIPLNELMALDSSVRQDLLNKADKIKVLVIDAGIPFSELMTQLVTLRRKVSSSFYRYPDKVKVLLIDAGIPFSEFMALKSDVREKLIFNADAVKVLLINAGISFNELMALEPDVRKELISNTEQVKDTRILAEFMSLNPDARRLVLADFDGIKCLLEASDISFNEFFALPDDIREQPGKVARWIGDDLFSLDEFMDLDAATKAQLLPDASYIWLQTLMGRANLSAGDIVDLGFDTRALIIENFSTLHNLVAQEKGTYEELFRLPAASLEIVLTNPDSPEAQEIIADLPSQQSTPGMGSGPG